jgi:nucleoside-diphosphate-sugar epimerase
MNRATSTVLLTGATGFVGSHLLKGLLASGYRVVALKRTTSSTMRIAGELSSVTAFDLDRVPLKAAFEHAPIDAVVHAATAYGRKGETASEVIAANVDLGTQLLETAAACGVATFINTGTFSAKGQDFPDGLTQYVRTKREFSEVGSGFAASGRIKFVELQLEHVYGPADERTKFVPTLLEALVEERASFDLTPGDQQRDFVYVDDVVAAYLRVLECRSELPQPSTRLEVGCGHAVALADFVRLARDVVGSRTELKFGALPYRVGEMQHSAGDISALTRLGWAPRVGLREGLERTVRALREVASGSRARRAP